MNFLFQFEFLLYTLTQDLCYRTSLHLKLMAEEIITCKKRKLKDIGMCGVGICQLGLKECICLYTH